MKSIIVFLIITGVPALFAGFFSCYLCYGVIKIKSIRFIINAALVYSLLFVTASFVYYTLLNPEYENWGALFSIDAFFWPILLNNCIYALIFPIFLFTIIPNTISVFIRQFFYNAGFLVFSCFSLILCTKIPVLQLVNNKEDMDLISALYSIKGLLNFNFVVLCLSSALFFGASRCDGIKKTLIIANQFLYLVLIVSLIFVQFYFPAGLRTIIRSFIFTKKYLLIVSGLSISASILFSLFNSKEFSFYDRRDDWPLLSKKIRNSLCNDARSYNTRLLISFFPILLFVSHYLLLKPLEVYFANIRDFIFSFRDYSYIYLTLSAVIIIICVLIVSLFKGIVFNGIVCINAAFGTASWIQGMLLNPEMGVLDGKRIAWADNVTNILINLLFWIAIIVLFLLLLKYIKNWHEVLSLVSAGFVVIQLVSVFSLSRQQEKYASEGNDSVQYYCIDESSPFLVSSRENTIVLVIDCFSSSYMDDLLAEYPDALDFLNDFTYYDNYEPNYFKTYPSMVHILTGYPLDPTISVEDNFKRSWNSDCARMFYDSLHDAGYKIRLFGMTGAYNNTIYGPMSEMYGKIDNIVFCDYTNDLDYTIDYTRLFRMFVKLAQYTDMPDILKRFHFLDTDSFDGIKVFNNSVITNEDKYYETLRKNGFETTDSEKTLIFQHLSSIQDPKLDEYCRTKINSTHAKTAKGCMVLLKEVLDSLKKSGVYDNSTIIVTADHGLEGLSGSTQCIFFIKEKGIRKDRLLVSHAPVSSNDIHKTILLNAGISIDSSDNSIYDFSENQLRERQFICYAKNSDYPSTAKYNSALKANYNEYRVYTYIGDRETIDEMTHNGDFVSIKMIDSYE